MALFRIESGASYDMSYEGEFEEPMGVAVGDDVGLAVGGDDETSDAAPVSRVPSSLSLRRGSRAARHFAASSTSAIAASMPSPRSADPGTTGA